MEERHYYKFRGYVDGSGQGPGLKIFKLTETEVEERLVKSGEIYERIPKIQERSKNER